MTEKKALESQVGKTIKEIKHHDIVGIVEIHMTDGSCIHINAQGKADANVMIIEPK